MNHPPLRGLSEVRHFLLRYAQPVTYFDVTCFQLLGMDEWIGDFGFVTFGDAFDGKHPKLFSPPRHRRHTYPFATLESCVNHLLRQDAVREHVRRHRAGGKAFFMMFNEETVELANELGLEVILPPPELRRSADNKVTATRLGDRAGVPSVPCVLGRIESYDDLRRVAGHLGEELVVQTPYGDSGSTTYFIRDADDFAAHRDVIVAEEEVKVMKRIRCRPTAIEACVTRAGTIVGPLLSELVGFAELTHLRGAWCGNEACPGIFDAEIRSKAMERTVKVGDELARLGYRGYFELDYLIDVDSGELFLGEINPRLTGASSMTNLASFAHADAPLFAFHLLEFSGVDFELDVNAINARWSDPAYLDSWSQMVIRHTEPRSVVLERAPASGVWRMGADGGADFVRMQFHRRTVGREDEAYLLRLAAVGDQVDLGDDLCFLVVRGRLMDADGGLTPRAVAWARAVRAQFSGGPLAAAQEG